MAGIGQTMDGFEQMGGGHLDFPEQLASLEGAVRRGEMERMPVEFARFVFVLEGRHLQRSGLAGQSHRADSGLQPSGSVSMVMLAALLAASCLQNSHTCLVLDGRGLKEASEAAGLEALSEAFCEIAEAEGRPGLSGWEQLAGELKALLESSSCSGGPSDRRPLVVHGRRLYLHRYWSYENRLAQRLRELASRPAPFMQGLKAEEKRAALRAGMEMVERIFSRGKEGASEQGPDWQRLAAVSALNSGLVVVSGGPGTGKTWTVTAMMAAIQAAASEAAGPLRMALCAPTGKAAARLSNSVRAAVQGFDLPHGLEQCLPRSAVTIHRLLGLGRFPGRFRFHRGNPLPFDLIIVDEASMVDLPMMVHLTEALADRAGLILLGDKDQLASVEAGAVLHDICAGMEAFSYSDSFWQRAGAEERVEAQKTHPLRDTMVQLTRNFRFLPGSGLSELASAVREGRAEEAARLLISDEPAAVRLITPEQEGLEEFIKREAGPWLEEILGQVGPAHAIKGLARLKILCAVKRGPAGVEMVNGLMDRLLSERVSRSGGAAVRAELADFSLRSASRYSRETAQGRPVIITRNDYRLELFNGDTGICWPDEQGRIRVWFESDEGGLRAFSPARLPAFEPAWAITVHRSQGSEYEKVLVVLPPEGSLMPGRELLYTAVTRARRQVVVWGSLKALEECLLRKTRRHSGLSDLLWV